MDPRTIETPWAEDLGCENPLPWETLSEQEFTVAAPGWLKLMLADLDGQLVH